MIRLFLLFMLMAWSGSVQAVDLSIEPLQPIEKLTVNAEQAALGEKLFFDKRLSADHSISCAHCHNIQDFGGADGLKYSFGVDGHEGMVNSPTVFNAALNFSQFWDGRAKDLFEQADGPVHNPKEFGSNWPEIVAKLKKDKD